MSKARHSTLQSYIAGFILSLILTGLAYYSVVSKAASGNALLAIILGLAMLQMLVQIFFFLHIGRGPKPLYNIIFFGGTVGLILVVVIGSIFIMDNLQYNMAPSEVTQRLSQNEAIAQVGGNETGACKQSGNSYKINIANNKPTPAVIKAKLCDTMTFINEGSETIEITFGAHPAHLSYGGQTDIPVTTKRPKTITLNQAGSYIFHDHLNPAMSGSFTVSN